MSLEEVLSSSVFKNHGFENISVKSENQEEIKVRVNLFTREDFSKWKNVFEELTCSTLISEKLLPSGEGHRYVFGQRLRCHHGRPHKGVKKTYTGCEFRVIVTIKPVSKNTIKNDKAVATHPGLIRIVGRHNHSTSSAAALKELSVLPRVRRNFEEYFEQGMGASQAARLHSMKRAAEGDWLEMARNDTNPTKRAVVYMHDVWRENEHGGYNDAAMAQSLKKYAAAHPELSIEVLQTEGFFCVSLVTPFMKRVHQEMREAGEVVFVDGTASVDRLNTCVHPLLCATPAGAAPLGVIFTSAQDEACLTTGFKLLQTSLGPDSFFGKGRPDCFMTDNSTPERKALASVWPDSKQFLCVFHILQQVWRWLLDTKHGIKKDQRQQLLNVTKSLVYAESPTSFTAIWEAYLASPMAESCDSFTRYMEELVERRAEWALAFRSGEVLRGHHTNNFAEATMCVIKDIVLNRSKAYNACQLVMLMAEVWDAFMRQRLVDVALGRRGRRATVCKTTSDLRDNVVQTEGGRNFKVRSEKDGSKVYDVDLQLGWCSCVKGQTGAVCKHQTACAEYAMTNLPQVYVDTQESRQWLAAVAMGKEAAPPADFFAGLVQQDESHRPSGAGEASTSAVAADEPSVDEAMDPSDDDFVDNIPPTPDQSVVVRPEKPSTAFVDALLSALGDTVRTLGDGMTEESGAKMISRLKRFRTGAQLNSALCRFGTDVVIGSGGCGLKIRCQPTSIARRREGVPRGAAPVACGRPPRTGLRTTAGKKRARNFAANVALNQANAKSHGSGH
ncbi:uncharacterized protein LOC122390827 [Amphibalanus amphitrite]|uniref:uncharacterized protein LOC122390827 n=1 Tax=Amphibalanus amphitrite TaxID=1232801 RepID=UPI001C91395B|nr:uncharacterized protein LOC122390827 [Amphibalanus amphitrite]